MNIFKNTYWFRNSGSFHTEQIEKNRLRFQIDYKLSKNIPQRRISKKVLNDTIFSLPTDHQEFYINENKNLVVIFSVYDNLFDYEKIGWKPIYPLFRKDCFSFVHEFER
jgi:hypothetical protein